VIDKYFPPLRLCLSLLTEVKSSREIGEKVQVKVLPVETHLHDTRVSRALTLTFRGEL